MAPTKKVNMFNINPLVEEVEEVLKKGLNKILVDYMARYELLENTHKQIMRLPSIRQELNKDPYDLYSDDETDINEPSNYNNRSACDRSIVESLEYRLEKLEKKYDTMIPILDKILNKIISLDQDVKSLKTNETFSPLNPYICNTDEKENIKIHFEEHSEKLGEEIEESDDEDLNPALITCSTITLNSDLDSITKPEVNIIPYEVEEKDQKLSVGEEKVVEGDSEEVVEDDSEDDSEEVVECDSEEVVEDDSEEVVEEEVVECDSEEDVLEEDAEEASIETETKTEDDEEDELEEELVKEAQLVRDFFQETQPDIKVPNEQKSSHEEEDDGDLFEIEIDDKTYCTNDDQNGFIWELTEDGEQGEKIGYLKDGDAYFYEDEN